MRPPAMTRIALETKVLALKPQIKAATSCKLNIPLCSRILYLEIR